MSDLCSCYVSVLHFIKKKKIDTPKNVHNQYITK